MKITIEIGPSEGELSAPVTVSITAPQPSTAAWTTPEGPLSTTSLIAGVPAHDAGQAPAFESLPILESVPPTVMMSTLSASTVTEADVSAGPGPSATGE
jgi:hypothetical protein